jgi:hypothetical protein
LWLCCQRRRFRVHSLLDKAHEALLRGEVGESLVVLERLGSRLGDEDVVAKVERLGSDGEVGRVRGEDDHGGALGEGSEGVLVYERERGTQDDGARLQASALRRLPSGKPRKDRSSPR